MEGAFRVLVSVFAVADARRRLMHCKGRCAHARHNLASAADGHWARDPVGQSPCPHRVNQVCTHPASASPGGKGAERYSSHNTFTAVSRSGPCFIPDHGPGWQWRRPGALYRRALPHGVQPWVTSVRRLFQMAPSAPHTVIPP
ncbi:DUF5958 family protein [Streptomyces sp. NPDC006529]|uniref:DUF5958 family protein n=1 Tax=Streptomyces sp. NPDC006529 TaxID=3157177 RepID=UPI00339F55D1